MSLYIGNLAARVTAVQQQHSCHVQLGHSLSEELALHSEGRQPQSAQLIFMP